MTAIQAGFERDQRSVADCKPEDRGPQFLLEQRVGLVERASLRRDLLRTRYNLASRFLEEVPQQLLKWLTPRFTRQRAFAPSFSRQTQAPFPRKPASREIGGFRIGQSVVHPKFGSGVIVDAEGQGSDARVQVNFGSQGVKWLAVAKLQAA